MGAPVHSKQLILLIFGPQESCDVFGGRLASLRQLDICHNLLRPYTSVAADVDGMIYPSSALNLCFCLKIFCAHMTHIGLQESFVAIVDGGWVVGVCPSASLKII